MSKIIEKFLNDIVTDIDHQIKDDIECYLAGWSEDVEENEVEGFVRSLDLEQLGKLIHIMRRSSIHMAYTALTGINESGLSLSKNGKLVTEDLQALLEGIIHSPRQSVRISDLDFTSPSTIEYSGYKAIKCDVVLPENGTLFGVLLKHFDLDKGYIEHCMYMGTAISCEAWLDENEDKFSDDVDSEDITIRRIPNEYVSRKYCIPFEI